MKTWKQPTLTTIGKMLSKLGYLQTMENGAALGTVIIKIMEQTEKTLLIFFTQKTK